MSTQTKNETVTLYYCEGSSDKVYQASLESKDGGFVVNFAFGRRGTTLQTGSKTAQPVDYAAARKIYDKLISEKSAKGYTPGEDGTPYQRTDKAERATGILPQLLNPIDEAEAERLLADPAWLTQEKLDGKRILIRCVRDDISGINRKGLIVALPQPVVEYIKQMPCPAFILDGESIGDTFIAFDLLEYGCVDIRRQPYRQRLDTLYCMPIVAQGAPLQTIRTAVKTADKRAMLARLREQKREGIVFKRIDAPYTPGRPASGGDQRKLKFYATASCIVAKANTGKRSVAIELCDNDQRVAVGNVTIPPGQTMPRSGEVLEVRYLYAYQGGSLFQPVFLNRRDDLAAAECKLAQLKYRASSEDEEA